MFWNRHLLTHWLCKLNISRSPPPNDLPVTGLEDKVNFVTSEQSHRMHVSPDIQIPGKEIFGPKNNPPNIPKHRKVSSFVWRLLISLSWPKHLKYHYCSIWNYPKYYWFHSWISSSFPPCDFGVGWVPDIPTIPICPECWESICKGLLCLI